jgi:two-component system phosphorelay protein LuxU
MDILNQEKIELLGKEIGAENIPMLLEIFVGELVSYSETLTNCSIDQRSDQLSEISHALKSSAASFGADQLCALAIDVDSQVKAGKTVGDDEQLQTFVHLLNQTCTVYQQLINP